VDNGYNGAKAAREARYGEAGAAQRALELTQRIDVQLFIAQLEAERAESERFDRERLLLEMKRLASFDVRKLYRRDGTLKEPHELDDDTAAAVEQIEVSVAGDEEIGVKKIKAASKIAAMKELGKHFNIYEDHQKATGTINITIEGKDAKL
jgi:phage terminase small subunit